MASDSDTAQADDPGSGTWLLAFAAVAVIGSAAALPLDGIGVHLLGYALASLLAFTCVALFRRRALERLLAVGAAASRTLSTLALVLLVAGLACSVSHAWFVARHWT